MVCARIRTNLCFQIIVHSYPGNCLFTIINKEKGSYSLIFYCFSKENRGNLYNYIWIFSK